jgi:hypothetical protein
MNAGVGIKLIFEVETTRLLSCEINTTPLPALHAAE